MASKARKISRASLPKGRKAQNRKPRTPGVKVSRPTIISQRVVTLQFTRGEKLGTFTTYVKLADPNAMLGEAVAKYGKPVVGAKLFQNGKVVAQMAGV